MDEIKLAHLREELDKAYRKRNALDVRIKNLEQRYNEAEKLCVYGVFQETNMTPEQFAELIRSLNLFIPPERPGIDTDDAENEEGNDEDTEEEDPEE